MIYKMQRPAGDKNGPWLMYDQRRSPHYMIAPRAVTQAMRDVMGNDLKCFVEATIEGEAVTIFKRVGEQYW